MFIPYTTYTQRLQTTLSKRHLATNPSINIIGYNGSRGRLRQCVTSSNTESVIDVIKSLDILVPYT